MIGPGATGPLRLVLASANPDKVKEIVAVLSAALPVELLPRPDQSPRWWRTPTRSSAMPA